MGNTFTVITTIIISVQVVTSGKCIGANDEKSEDNVICDTECSTHTDAGERRCIAAACPILSLYCRWEKDDGEKISNPSVVVVPHAPRTRTDAGRKHAVGHYKEAPRCQVTTDMRRMKKMEKQLRLMEEKGKEKELKKYITERFGKCNQLESEDGLSSEDARKCCELDFAKELCGIYFRDGVDEAKLSPEMKIYVSTRSYFMYSLTAHCHLGKVPSMNTDEQNYFKQEKSDKSHITQYCRQGYVSGEFKDKVNVNDFCYTYPVIDASSNYCHKNFGRKTWKILKVEDKTESSITGFRHLCGWPDYYSYKDRDGKTHRTKGAGTTIEDHDGKLIPMIPGLGRDCEKKKRETHICVIQTDVKLLLTHSAKQESCADYGRKDLEKPMSAIERWVTSSGYKYGHFIIQQCLCKKFSGKYCLSEKVSSGASAYVGYDNVYSSNAIGFYNNDAIGDYLENLEEFIYKAGYQQGVKATKQRQRGERSRLIKLYNQRD